MSSPKPRPAVVLNPENTKEAMAFLSRKDALMKALIAQHGECNIGKKRRDPFQVLASSIIGQQLSVKAADTIESRVKTLVGADKKFVPQHFIDADPLKLRECGLSHAKAKYLRGISASVAGGETNFTKIKKMPTEEAAAALIALPGVGRWTAEMFLMFALKHADLFSWGDVGLRRGINNLYNGGEKLSEAETVKLAQTWAPWRTVACWYLWRHADAEPNSWS